MKLAMDLFGELDQEALAVARGASSASLAELGSSCVNAFTEIARSIGTNLTSCEDHSDLSADQWKQLHHEIGQLSTLNRKSNANCVCVCFFYGFFVFNFCSFVYVCLGLLCCLCGLFLSSLVSLPF